MTKPQLPKAAGTIQGFPSQGLRRINAVHVELDGHTGFATIYCSTKQERGAPSRLVLSPSLRQAVADGLTAPMPAPAEIAYRITYHYESPEDYARGQGIPLDQAEYLFNYANKETP